MTVVHLLRLDLELDTPGGVSAPESTTIGSVLAPDLPVARDGWGEPYLPGTSVAGSLRAAAPAEVRTALFGRELGGEEPDRASAVRVLGTTLGLPDRDGELQTRRRTAVHRHRAAAAAKTLHTRELLPPGTKLRVWLRLDEADGVPGLDELIDVLRRWRPYIGGGRGTGHGHAHLRRVRHRRLDLDTVEGLTFWLRHGGPELVDDTAEIVLGGGAGPAPYVFGRALSFRVVDALHIGTGDRPAGGPRATGPAPVLRDHQGVPVVPGTSWKGVLRARVEYVLRSVGLPVCTSVGGEGTCGSCVVCGDFGWTGSTDDTDTAVGARGPLLFTDSVISGSRPRVRRHVALDRVFGGARPGALYAEEVIEEGTLALHIRSDRSPDPLVRAALVLALCDVADGYVGIGRGTTRGQGTLAAVGDARSWLDAERPDAQRVLREHLAARAQLTSRTEGAHA